MGIISYNYKGHKIDITYEVKMAEVHADYQLQYRDTLGLHPEHYRFSIRPSLVYMNAFVDYDYSMEWNVEQPQHAVISWNINDRKWEQLTLDQKIDALFNYVIDHVERYVDTMIAMGR